jgi:hypothetical protein
MTLPLASFAVAESAEVWPTTSALAVGVTATVATGGGGLTGSGESEDSEQAISEAMIAENATTCATLRYCMVRDIWESCFE